MNVEEENKLIAKFLEWKHEGSSVQGLAGFWSGSNYYKYKDLKFHEDWNWLMPVIEEIERLEFGDHEYLTFNITGGNNPYVESSTGEEIVSYMGLEKTKLETCYEVVIRFIKWYNKT